jgi:hypothetical protein
VAGVAAPRRLPELSREDEVTEHNNPAAELAAFDPLADVDRDVFELRYDLQQAQAEVQRLTKLAEANGGQARFWADHFAEVEKVDRDALGAHRKPGHSVAELITAVAQELGREKRCYQTAFEGREHAWDQLKRISDVMGVDEDDFAVEAVAGEVERYVDQVKFVTERLTRERDEAREHLDKVRQALRTPGGWATKMHALHVRQQRDKARDVLGAIWLYVPWRSITRHLTTEQRELWADAVEDSGDPGSTIAVDRWWRDDASVSGSDTTEDGGDRG